MERHLREAGLEPRLEVIELRAHAVDLANQMLTGFPSPTLQAALDAVLAADGVIAVTPIFSGSYSGLFKLFFDAIDRDGFRAKPVLIAATGGTPRHSLAIEHAVRPLFAYLRAAVVPTGVYAATEDWGQGRGDGRQPRRADRTGGHGARRGDGERGPPRRATRSPIPCRSRTCCAASRRRPRCSAAYLQAANQSSTRSARSVFQRLGLPSPSSISKVGLARVDVLERPAAVGIAIVLDDSDRLGHALVGPDLGVAQVVEPAQDVVVPPGREREPQPVGVDHLAGRLPTEQPALEHVLLAALAGLPDLGRAADRPLVLEQALEDVDRRPERRHRRAVLDLAVPAAVRELLAEQPLDERRHVDAEVGARRDDVAVDARLDLALEERGCRPTGSRSRDPAR